MIIVFSNLLPDTFRHNNFQYKVLHLNIQGYSMRICLGCPITTLFKKIGRLNLKATLRCTYEIIFNSIFVKMYLIISIEGEFESIFVESVVNAQTSIVGEIYHIPNTNVTLSI